MFKNKVPKTSGNPSPLTVVLIMLLAGFIIIAVIDENYRSPFAYLAMVGVGTALGILIPPSSK